MPLRRRRGYHSKVGLGTLIWPLPPVGVPHQAARVLSTWSDGGGRAPRRAGRFRSMDSKPDDEVRLRPDMLMAKRHAAKEREREEAADKSQRLHCGSSAICSQFWYDEATVTCAALAGEILRLAAECARRKAVAAGGGVAHKAA
jgi:hypothetical protein